MVAPECSACGVIPSTARSLDEDGTPRSGHGTSGHKAKLTHPTRLLQTASLREDRSLTSGRIVGWRIPGQQGPLGEALRGPQQQLWDKILDSAVDLVFNSEKHHQRVGFASPGDSVMQVMEDSGLKKTQVDKVSRRCSS